VKPTFINIDCLGLQTGDLISRSVLLSSGLNSGTEISKFDIE